MQRKIRFYIVLVFSCIFCLFGCKDSSWDKAEKVKNVKAGKKEEVKIYKSSDMEVSLKYGFCGIVQKNESLPIEITIRTDKMWKGRIKILLPISSDKEAAYEQKVTAKKGENTKKLTIPSIGDFSYFKICLEDEKREKMVTTKVQTDITQEENKLYMGILGETEVFSCFDGLKKQKGETEAKIVSIPLEVEEIPEEEKQLSALDYLVINHLDETLSKRQRQAIQKWVKQGGILIVGTGGEKIDALDSLIDVVATRQSERKEKVLLSFYSQEERKNIILDHISFRVQSGIKYESLLERSLLKKIPYGEGFFCISEIDLDDPIIEKYEQKIGALILDQITTKRFYSLVKERETVVRGLTRALNFNYGERMPSIFIYISLFIVYIGLIGPAVYFILKHFDRKTWFFFIVFLLSCIFTALVFYVSHDYKKEMPMINILTMLNAEEEKETIYLSAQNSKNKEYSLDFYGDIDFVEAIPNLSSLYGAADAYQLSEKEEEYTVEKRKEDFSIRFSKKSILNQDILKLEKEKEKEIGDFQYDLNFSDDFLNGKLSNQTKYDFSYVLFYYQKKYWVCKDFKQKAEATIEKDDISLLDLTKSEKEYFLSEENYPSQTTEQYLELEENQKIFAFLYENMLKEDDTKGYFIGIADGAEEKIILKDKKIEPKQKMVYVQPFSKEDVAGDTVINILELYLQKMDGDIYGGVLYSKTADLSYQFVNQNVIGELVRLDDYYNGKIYAYNYKKKEYDEVLSNQQERLTKDKLVDYIDEGGNLRVYLKTEADYTQIPVLAMIEGV